MTTPPPFDAPATEATPPRSTVPVGVLWACVCMALAVAAAVLWTALWQRQALQSSLWQAHGQQQQAVADTWARLLTVRLEAQQRTVGVLAQAMPQHPTEQAAAVQDWMAQGSMLGVFDSLHVVRADGGMATFHVGALAPSAQPQASQALTPEELHAVQATLADGKPRMHSHVQPPGEGLQVLLVMPMPRGSGADSALAARVHWPLAWLLPLQPQAASSLAFQLLDPQGQLLAQSGGTTPAQAQALQVLAQHGAEWRDWLRHSAGAAQVQQWGAWLLARVSLPQAQWEVVVVGALPTLPWQAGGAPWWGWALGWAAVVGLAGMAMVWGWQRWGARALHAEDLPAHAVQGADAAGDALHVPLRVALPLQEAGDVAWPACGRAMLDMATEPLLAVHGETVRLCNVHAQLLLGYSAAELEGQHVSVLFGDVPALVQAHRQVREQMQYTGGYSGALQLRRRDGSAVAVQLHAQRLAEAGAYTVWRLHPPAAVWRRSVWQAPEIAPGQDERDALTGLPNRAALGWQLQAWAAKAVPAAVAPGAGGAAWAPLPTTGCVMVLDVDHLGALNEVASRSFGDRVLAHVAQLLHAQLRSIGWVARLGGDEFVAVLPGLSLAHAQTVGQRLCHAVQQWRPLWREEVHTVSISVGVVAVDVLRHDLHQALRAADLACYEAKRQGRGQVAAGQVAHAEVPRTYTAG